MSSFVVYDSHLNRKGDGKTLLTWVYNNAAVAAEKMSHHFQKASNLHTKTKESLSSLEFSTSTIFKEERKNKANYVFEITCNSHSNPSRGNGNDKSHSAVYTCCTDHTHARRAVGLKRRKGILTIVGKQTNVSTC